MSSGGESKSTKGPLGSSIARRLLAAMPATTIPRSKAKTASETWATVANPASSPAPCARLASFPEASTTFSAASHPAASSADVGHCCALYPTAPPISVLALHAEALWACMVLRQHGRISEPRPTVKQQPPGVCGSSCAAMPTACDCRSRAACSADAGHEPTWYPVAPPIRPPASQASRLTPNLADRQHGSIPEP